MPNTFQYSPVPRWRRALGSYFLTGPGNEHGNLRCRLSENYELPEFTVAQMEPVVGGAIPADSCSADPNQEASKLERKIAGIIRPFRGKVL